MCPHSVQIHPTQVELQLLCVPASTQPERTQLPNVLRYQTQSKKKKIELGDKGRLWKYPW